MISNFNDGKSGSEEESHRNRPQGQSQPQSDAEKFHEYMQFDNQHQQFQGSMDSFIEHLKKKHGVNDTAKLAEKLAADMMEHMPQEMRDAMEDYKRVFTGNNTEIGEMLAEIDQKKSSGSNALMAQEFGILVRAMQQRGVNLQPFFVVLHAMKAHLLYHMYLGWCAAKKSILGPGAMNEDWTPEFEPGGEADDFNAEPDDDDGVAGGT